MVQCLRLHASTTGDTGSIPGQEAKIPHALWCSQKKKKVCVHCVENNTMKHKILFPAFHVIVPWLKARALYLIIWFPCLLNPHGKFFLNANPPPLSSNTQPSYPLTWQWILFGRTLRFSFSSHKDVDMRNKVFLPTGEDYSFLTNGIDSFSVPKTLEM